MGLRPVDPSGPGGCFFFPHTIAFLYYVSSGVDVRCAVSRSVRLGFGCVNYSLSSSCSISWFS